MSSPKKSLMKLPAPKPNRLPKSPPSIMPPARSPMFRIILPQRVPRYGMEFIFARSDGAAARGDEGISPARWDGWYC